MIEFSKLKLKMAAIVSDIVSNYFFLKIYIEKFNYLKVTCVEVKFKDLKKYSKKAARLKFKMAAIWNLFYSLV